MPRHSRSRVQLRSSPYPAGGVPRSERPSQQYEDSLLDVSWRVGEGSAPPPATLSDSENDEDSGDAGLFNDDSDATDLDDTVEDDDDVTDAEISQESSDHEGDQEDAQTQNSEAETVVLDESVILISDSPRGPSSSLSDATNQVPIVSSLPIKALKPQSPTTKLKFPNGNLEGANEDERSQCSICMENMTSDGDHEIIVLTNCGHLFGQKCISKWIKMKKECPNCKKKTTKMNIRKIYPASMPLVVQDNSQVENLRRQVEEMSTKNSKLHQQLSVSESQLRSVQENLKANEAFLQHLRLNRTSSFSDLSSGINPNIRFRLKKEEKILAESVSPLLNDACRLIAIDDPCNTKIMCVSSISGPSTYGLTNFSHGVHLLDVALMQKTKYIAIHKGEVRDMKFGSGYLLTGSNDKSIKILDIEHSKITRSFYTSHPVWSVAWNKAKHMVYGGTKGVIVEYDTRSKDKEPSRKINATGVGIHQPVHSLYFKNNGLLFGQFKSIQWFGLEDPENSRSILSQCSKGTCMPFHNFQDNLLATFRNKPPVTQFTKLSCGVSPRKLTQEIVAEFSVTSQHDKITRDRLFKIHGETIASCTNQQSGCLQLHNTTNGGLVQRFERAKNTILDSAQFQVGEYIYIAELDGRSVRFHEQVSP